ncbi:MAG: glycosyltransferase family 2 protein [Archangium sp.]
MKSIAVIPAHDEAETIADVVRRTRAHVTKVIVVDDGSRDDTAQKAEAAGATVSRLVPNRGKGQALVHGLELALKESPDAVVTLDADGEHDPDDVPKLLAALESADVALGVRHTFRSGARAAMNRLALFWFQLLDPAIEDTICGLRAFRAEKLPLLHNDEGGFVYEHEVLIRAVLHGLRLVAVPIHTVPTVSSHVTMKEVLRANNHFDRRVLASLTKLPLPLWKRGLLAVGCVGGLALGVPAEAVLRARSRK